MKRISRNRKFYLIMIVEVLIVGLVSYWICRDPRELEKYEESFIKEFVHPHKDSKSLTRPLALVSLFLVISSPTASFLSFELLSLGGFLNV